MVPIAAAVAGVNACAPEDAPLNCRMNATSICRDTGEMRCFRRFIGSVFLETPGHLSGVYTNRSLDWLCSPADTFLNQHASIA